LVHPIVSALQSREEQMLPGLDALFELLWQHASDSEKNEMLKTLEGGLNPAQ
ncbi:small acid-soluble spore protein SspI, partial [Paenibacillus polymyxa]